MDEDLWMEFVNEPLGVCGLCGNSGIVDTQGNAHSPRGIECGVKQPCICPNGRCVKEHGEVKLMELHRYGNARKN